MGVSKKDVEYIAKLAKLKLNESELEGYTSDMNEILEYIEKLNELDTENVEPLSHPLGSKNVLREDETIESIDRSKALKNAPNANDEFFKVPKVIKQNTGK
ncbi:MAG: Asp-tRNA(Asn)/Glu-tRNA(Gln) amidotransferase subunit GatC [Ignavibacteria bacterium]|nr:MAG: Asp-tRNA(Asn)/Glu-tRNA(Gln) amidotransferase subunit GatC [Ignavibacteria bacterium]